MVDLIPMLDPIPMVDPNPNVHRTIAFDAAPVIRGHFPCFLPKST